MMKLDMIKQALNNGWYKIGKKLVRTESSDYKFTLEHFDEFLEFPAYDAMTVTHILTGQVLAEFVEEEALRDFMATRVIWGTDRDWTEEEVKVEFETWVGKQRVKCPKCNDNWTEMHYLIDLEMCPDCYIKISKEVMCKMALEIHHKDEQPKEDTEPDSKSEDRELANIINQYLEK